MLRGYLEVGNWSGIVSRQSPQLILRNTTILIEVMAIQLIGPLAGYDHPHYHLSIDGCLVPYLEITERSDTAGLLTMTLADRISIDVPREQLNLWGWFVANAMAWAAGFTCHGSGSIPRNPFASKVHQLDSLPGDAGCN